MKKITIISISLFLILSLILTGCGSNYSNIEKPTLTDEQKSEYEKTVEDNLTILEQKDLAEDAKYQALVELAVNNEYLGNYDEAINYYKQILEISDSDFLALNNLSNLYEKLEEYDLASQYVKFLNKYYKDKQSVVKDTIRILIKNKEFDNAQLVITEYAQNYQSPETQTFISDEFDFIKRSKEKETEAGK